MSLVAFSEEDGDKKELIVFNLHTKDATSYDTDHRFTQLEFGKNNLIILTDQRGNILVFDIIMMKKVSEISHPICSYSKDHKYAHLVLDNKYILIVDSDEIYLLDYLGDPKSHFSEIKIFEDGSLLNYHAKIGPNNLLTFVSRLEGKIYIIKLDGLDLENIFNAETKDELANYFKNKLNSIVNLNEIKSERLSVRTLEFSPDGKYLINSVKKGTNIINLDTKNLMADLSEFICFRFNHEITVLFTTNSESFAYSASKDDYPFEKFYIFIYKTPKGMAQELTLEEIFNIAAGDLTPQTGSFWASISQTCNII